MSGHSKWKNIMHKKAKTDAQRASLFTKIGREISIAVRDGGPDPNSNRKLRELIAKAKANNVPNENIERIIKKATGGDAEKYEEITYEGYGPGGVAMIVATTTDNRNRTSGDLRHLFDKYGGNLGATGCVSYLFSDKGVIIVERKEGVDEDKLMECALEAGAVDFLTDDEEVYEIRTEPDDLYSVRDAIADAGFEIASAEQDKIPSVYVQLIDPEQIKMMELLLEKLEDNDDVQEVYHNCENVNI